MNAKMGCDRISGTAVANSLTLALDAAFGTRPAALPPGKAPLPIVQEAGWASEMFRRVRKDLPPTGLELRIFEPAASSYTDCTIPAALRM